MDPSTPDSDRPADAASPAESVSPPRRQFSLAQLLTIVFACGAFFALMRLLNRFPDDVDLSDWVLVIAGGVAATILFDLARLKFAAQISVIVTAFVIFLAIWAHAWLGR